MIRLSGNIQPMDMTDQNDMVDYVIEPLTFKYLLPALRLVDSVFPRREQGGERADLAFTASLLTLGRRVAKWMGYPMVRYWIVRDVATNRIYGTIGHYVRAEAGCALIPGRGDWASGKNSSILLWASRFAEETGRITAFTPQQTLMRRKPWRCIIVPVLTFISKNTIP